MCLSAPVQVLVIDGPRARVRMGATELTVSALAVPELHSGDWAILSGGMLVRRIEPTRAAEIAAALGVATDR